MVQGEGFKHITVTAPEEDDVVIVAGAVEEPPIVELPADEPPAEVEARDEVESLDKVKADDEPVFDEAPVKQASRTLPKQAKDSYHETTLDDLESAPMPMAQRIVIIAAIICIIGAVIYYLAFMG